MTFYNFFTNLNTNYFDFGLNNWFSPFNNVFIPNLTSLFTPISCNFNNFITTPIFPVNGWSTASNNFTDYSFSFNNKFSPGTTTDGQNRKRTNNYNYAGNGNINNGYLHLSKSAAYQKALNDSNLENLSNGGRKWQISTASFKTDIPFAKKGTGKILDEVASKTGCNLVVTSALGTGQAGNPHQRGGYKSHHNADNPKLDLSIPSGMSASAFEQKLRNTGYFSHILNEGDHIDVQIDPSKYNSLNALA